MDSIRFDFQFNENGQEFWNRFLSSRFNINVQDDKDDSEGHLD